MNYLQMAQKVREIVGITGSGPSSVNTSGPESVILSLVNASWQDIQNARQDWKWMRDVKTFSTTAGKSTYTITDLFTSTNRFKSWYKETFKILLNSSYNLLVYVDPVDYELMFSLDTQQKVPTMFTIDIDSDAFITTPPDSVYQISAEYKKSNQVLIQDTDTPEVHSDYHLLIVYDAVARYALSIGFTSLYLEYSKRADTLLSDLMRSQIPAKTIRLQGIA